MKDTAALQAMQMLYSKQAWMLTHWIKHAAPADRSAIRNGLHKFLQITREISAMHPKTRCSLSVRISSQRFLYSNSFSPTFRLATPA